MDHRIVATTNLGLAAFWMSRGLAYHETDATTPTDCTFRFVDPAGNARRLREEFHGNHALQMFIHARLSLTRTLAIAKAARDRRCRLVPPSSRRRGATD